MSEKKIESENQEQKTEAESRAREIQRGQEEKNATLIIADCDQRENELYASRGYGGYIKTEDLIAIRDTRRRAEIHLRGLQLEKSRSDVTGAAPILR